MHNGQEKTNPNRADSTGPIDRRGRHAAEKQIKEYERITKAAEHTIGAAGSRNNNQSS
jgi:hypothetical protein